MHRISEVPDSLGSVFPSPGGSSRDGHWRALYLELMPGSGECLTIGVVVYTDREAMVKIAPGLGQLRCVYGDAIESFLWAAEKIGQHIERHISVTDLGNDFATEIPIEGLRIGPSRKGRAADLSAIANDALALSSSVMIATRRTEELSVAESRSAPMPNLERSVRELVTAREPELRDAFNREFRARQDVRATRVGFVGRHLAANFGKLLPNRVGPLVKDAKSKLWDLAQVRQDLESDGRVFSAGISRYELLLCRDNAAREKGSKRTRQTLLEAEAELEFEADRQEIRCRVLSSPGDIANRLIAAEIG